MEVHFDTTYTISGRVTLVDQQSTSLLQFCAYDVHTYFMDVSLSSLPINTL